MADHSSIEWTDATWNPITGCSVISPGCTNCYAMKLAGTRMKHTPSREGLTRDTKAGPVWTGEVRLNREWIDQPLRWRKPRRIFVCAHGDLFHETVPGDWIDQVFSVMARAPQHTFQVLTKRPARMREYLSRFREPKVATGFITRDGEEPLSYGGKATTIFSKRNWPLHNVWLGVSAEDQVRADERIPDLLATPAAVRFVSAEPLLGPVDIGWALAHPIRIAAGFLERGRFSPGLETLRPLDWVIVGGESGANARPMHHYWVRALRDDCARAGTAFFFKQWGEFSPYAAGPVPYVDVEDPGNPAAKYRVGRVGKKAAGRLLDGAEHNGMPERVLP